MLKHSFTVNGLDMRERFGLIVEEFEDVLTPKLRPRKLVVPGRDGAFDYGADTYDERELIVHCAAVSLDRLACRDLSLALARKATIVRWDEPDKYYVGRVYDPAEIERIAGKAKRFEISFECDPFAYGKQKTEVYINSKNIAYGGTARTPPRIAITNINSYAISGLTIILREAIIP